MSLKRIAIKRRLLEGIAPEHVAEELKVSVETVMSVERLLRADPAAAHALNARPTPAPSASIDEAVGRAADEVVARASVDEVAALREQVRQLALVHDEMRALDAQRIASLEATVARLAHELAALANWSRPDEPGDGEPEDDAGAGDAPPSNQIDGLARAEARPRSVAIKRITKESLQIGRLVYPERLPQLPATRADCRGLQRPCPHVRCKWHLFLDVNQRSGSIKFNFPGREVWELTSSCALDVAERGGETLEEVAERLNITRERVRQIEVNTASRLRDDYDLEDFDELSACWGGVP
jgi:DNA-binding CsgD family transcriptional regulator